MARPKPCPLCGKSADPLHAPFCSQGCRDRDLMRWLSEGYAIAVTTPPEDAEDGLDTAPSRD